MYENHKRNQVEEDEVSEETKESDDDLEEEDQDAESYAIEILEKLAKL